jgi:hypothetical protein
MPEDRSKQIFDEMVLEGFKGVKRVMEVEDLQDSLSETDIQKVAGAIAKSMVNWCEFMRLATRGKEIK